MLRWWSEHEPVSGCKKRERSFFLGDLNPRVGGMIGEDSVMLVMCTKYSDQETRKAIHNTT